MCSNMDEPKDYQTNWSKLERERQISYHLHEESKIWNNISTKQKQTHVHWKETCLAKEEESWGSDELGVWD